MSFVKEQLDLISGEIKVQFKGAYALVQCPFHKNGQETHPSLMVNLEDPRFEEGFHYCLSCSAKGSWNALAEALDLEKTQDSKKRLNSLKIKQLKLKQVDKFKKDTAVSLPWTPSDNWRGVDGKLLTKLNARLRLEPKTKDKQIDLPVLMLGRVVGHIYGALQKKPKELGSSYINSPGPWVKKALFPFDVAVNMLKASNNPLPFCLVEGPRDALNLLQHGLPAAAILGCSNWSKSLIPILLTLRPTALVILMDGDAAGQAASTLIYNDLLPFLSKTVLKVCKLPQGKDPADLDKSQVEMLIKHYS